ncbi:hypothetical protein AVEN_60011-1 [Araneus ventricosus]|uniref:Uncharacterized protein n=1 Tax=Araneus ventricosus TaxID=182803 RepID=A0A4Y2CBI8_ARAVE|nr:hypothetical protein AVEN_60011-1 [Araneus ventricosus]
MHQTASVLSSLQLLMSSLRNSAMGSFTKILIFLSVLTCMLAFEEESHKTSSTNSTRLGRTGRKNYGLYRPPPSRDYGDDGDDKVDSNDDTPSSPNTGNPPQGGDYPNFGNYKGYDQYFNYAPPRYPSFAPNYKGSPFYSPYWKGGKPLDSAMPSASPDQMMEMMMALSNMEDTTKPEDTGILSKLISDPKAAAAAAIIPLSIVAAAVVPVLMNYMMTGANQPQVISTTANNKEARSLDASNNFEMIMENISRFARAMDNDECVQKTICRIVRGDADVPVSDYMKKAASSLARMVKDDWMNNYGVKNLVDGIKQGNCNNVCNIVKGQSKQR